jgi:hypothetical protein
MIVLRLLPLCIASVFAITPVASGQEEERPFLVHPAKGSQTSQEGDYFVLKGSPGRTIRQGLVLRNITQKPLVLTVVPIDAVTNTFGNVAYTEIGVTPEEVGAWITLEQERMSVPPDGTRTVGFRVEIPDDAREGVNLGALGIQVPGDPSVGRAVVAVQVNAPGPRTAELIVSGVKPRAKEGALFLDVSIENRGSSFASGSGLLRLKEDRFEHPIEIDTFVPGTDIGFPVLWTREPSPGRYAAEVRIEYGGGRVAEWTGTFTVGEKLIDQLSSADGGGDSEALRVLLVAALVVGGAFYVGMWRARSASVPGVAAPAKGPAAATGGDRTTSRKATTGSARKETTGKIATDTTQKKTTRKKTTRKKTTRKKTTRKKTTRKKTTRKKTTRKKTTGGQVAGGETSAEETTKPSTTRSTQTPGSAPEDREAPEDAERVEEEPEAG